MFSINLPYFQHISTETLGEHQRGTRAGRVGRRQCRAFITGPVTQHWQRVKSPAKQQISSQCQCHRYALHHLRPHASDMHIISECTVPATSSIDGVKQWMLHGVRVGRDSPQPTPCPAAALPCCSDLAHRQAGLVRVVRHRGVRNRRRRARRPRCGPRCGRLVGLGRVVIVQRFEHRGRGLVEHRA